MSLLLSKAFLADSGIKSHEARNYSVQPSLTQRSDAVFRNSGLCHPTIVVTRNKSVLA